MKMERKNRTCHCFDYVTSINDLDPDNILLYEKSYKVPYGAKPLRNVFDKVDRYIKTYERTKYLAFFHSDEKYKMLKHIMYHVENQHFRRLFS